MAEGLTTADLKKYIEKDDVPDHWKLGAAKMIYVTKLKEVFKILDTFKGVSKVK